MGCNATPTRDSGLINNRINLQEKDDYPILETISVRYPDLRRACEARALLETGAANGQPFQNQPSGE